MLKKLLLQIVALVILPAIGFDSIGGEKQAARDTTRPPNIVLIVADDLGWGDLGCYGSNWLKTPHIDSLAKNGCRFTDYYCTTPKCSPTRASILTGCYPGSLKIHNVIQFQRKLNASFGTADHLENTGPQMGQLFQELGFRTGFFGKWHLGSHPGAPLVTEYGFDVAATTVSRNWKWHPNLTPEFNRKVDGYIADETLKFIEANQDTPFLAVVSFFTPHAPLNPSPKHLASYSEYHDQRYPHPNGAEVFGAAISNLDQQVGRILEALPENTLTLFTSDNGPPGKTLFNPRKPGPAIGSHHLVASTGPFRGGKTTLYEGGIRVPLIAHWPGRIGAGSQCDTTIASIDLLPSCLTIANGKSPALPCDGEDMSEAILGQTKEDTGAKKRKEPLFFEYRYGRESPFLAMREGNYKLLANPDGSRKELYDLSTELGLREVNQHNDPAMTARMFKRLVEWHQALPQSPADAQAGKFSYQIPNYQPK